MSCDDSTFIKERIERTKELILVYEEAIAVLSSGAQSYSLDTGQTRQSVTKAQMSQLKNMLEYLENRLTTLQARLGCARVHVKPGF